MATLFMLNCLLVYTSQKNCPSSSIVYEALFVLFVISPFRRSIFSLGHVGTVSPLSFDHLNVKLIIRVHTK